DVVPVEEAFIGADRVGVVFASRRFFGCPHVAVSRCLCGGRAEREVAGSALVLVVARSAGRTDLTRLEQRIDGTTEEVLVGGTDFPSRRVVGNGMSEVAEIFPTVIEHDLRD